MVKYNDTDFVPSKFSLGFGRILLRMDYEKRGKKRNL